MDFIKLVPDYIIFLLLQMKNIKMQVDVKNNQEKILLEFPSDQDPDKKRKEKSKRKRSTCRISISFTAPIL